MHVIKKERAERDIENGICDLGWKSEDRKALLMCSPLIPKPRTPFPCCQQKNIFKVQISTFPKLISQIKLPVSNPNCLILFTP